MNAEIRTPCARYSTKEVAARLFLSELRTRHLLLAAGIPHTKFGQSYAWSADHVDRLVRALPKIGVNTLTEPSENHNGWNH